MKVLVACEESQRVCIAFRKRGFEAFSCDILPCSGGHPEWHIQDDVLKHLDDGWDMMIAHPPCTYIARAGTRWLYPKHKLNQDRYQKGLEAKEFFLKLLNANIPMIAVENPVPHKIFGMPKETQIIQPFFFGCDVQKTTYLWLKNLPKLKSTNSLFKHEPPSFIRDSKGIRHSKWFMDCGFNAGKEKSRTFRGVAEAMAVQWGSVPSKARVPILTESKKSVNKEKVINTNIKNGCEKERTGFRFVRREDLEAEMNSPSQVPKGRKGRVA